MPYPSRSTRAVWGCRSGLGTVPALVASTRPASRHTEPLDVHGVPAAGHWSAFENAPEVNRLLLEFFSTA